MEALQVVADARVLVQRPNMGSARSHDLVVTLSCWTRVLPKPVCRVLASFFLLKVQPPPESEGVKAQLDHKQGEWFKVWESWKRITARHERRGWNHHPHGCYDPTNLRWCIHPNCEEVGTGSVQTDRTRYYCSEHHPYADMLANEPDE